MSKYFNLLHQIQMDKELLDVRYPDESKKIGMFGILSKTSHGQHWLAPLRPELDGHPEPASSLTAEQESPEQVTEAALSQITSNRKTLEITHGRTAAAPLSRFVSPRALALLRAAGTRLGILSNDPPPAPQGGPDLKALVRQEEIKLVRQVFLSADSRLNKMIVFFGGERGEASAHVCARTAATLALQVQSSVCVVDANLRSPMLHRYFGSDNVVGLSEVLTQPGLVGEYAHKTEIKNLWLIPCGQSNHDARVWHYTAAVRSLFNKLRRQFEYVLVNAPPLGAPANATAISQMADGVICVVEADCTPREMAQRLKDSLVASNSRILGVVLNNRTFPIPQSIYRRL
jgi:protein-tyrosine kinase